MRLPGMTRTSGALAAGAGEDRYGELLDALPRPVRKTRYPWAVWSDGQARKLKRGRHFAGTVDGMRSTLTTHARSRDIAVAIVTRTADEAACDEARYIHFQFFPQRRFADGPPGDLFDA